MLWTIPIGDVPPRNLLDAIAGHPSWRGVAAGQFRHVRTIRPFPFGTSGLGGFPWTCHCRGWVDVASPRTAGIELVPADPQVVALRPLVLRWVEWRREGPVVKRRPGPAATDLAVRLELAVDLGRCPHCRRIYWATNWGEPVVAAEVPPRFASERRAGGWADALPWEPADPPSADQQIRADLVAEAAAVGVLLPAAAIDAESLVELRGLEPGYARGGCECPFCPPSRAGVPRLVPLDRAQLELVGVRAEVFVGRCEGGCGRVYWGDAPAAPGLGRVV